MSNKRQYTVSGEGDEERVWQVQTLAEGRYRVWTPEGQELEVDAFAPGSGQLHLLFEGRSVDVDFREEESTFSVQAEGENYELEVLNDRQRRMRAAGAGRAGKDSPQLVSPMAGKVVDITAEVGQVVELGEPLVVVEAMKMENDLKAHRAGVVTSVGVEVGEAVEIGDVLITIEDPQ